MLPSFIRRQLKTNSTKPSQPRDERAAARIAGGLGQGFAAFGERNYRLYWGGQVVSLIGTFMQSVSLPWLVLLLGGSPLELGIVGAAQFTPALVLAPFGGVLADRLDKRRTLMVISVVAAIEALALFVLTLTGVIAIWHVIVLAAVIGVANAFEMPVRQSFVAELVPREVLANAIALSSMAFNGARVIGPAVGGVLIAAFGVGANFGINAASFAAVLAALALMRVMPATAEDRPQPQPVMASLVEGLRFALRTPKVLWPLATLLGLAVFAMQFTILVPLFARNVLALGPEGYGGLFAAMGAGSLLASLLLAFLQRRPFGPLVLGAGALFLLTEALFGLSRALVAVYLFAALAGFFSMLVINTINVTIQSNVPDVLRGRVMSLYVVVLVGSAPFGALFAGTVAELWGAPVAFLLGSAIAALFLAAAGWRLLGTGAWLRARRRAVST